MKKYGLDELVNENKVCDLWNEQRNMNEERIRNEDSNKSLLKEDINKGLRH